MANSLNEWILDDQTLKLVKKTKAKWKVQTALPISVLLTSPSLPLLEPL